MHTSELLCDLKITTCNNRIFVHFKCLTHAFKILMHAESDNPHHSINFKCFCKDFKY